ncbi:MAG: hypothetical protein M1536_08255 [Firmicutes bacterium]|nr:hypothetical protein [Bacillota bacterium]
MKKQSTSRHNYFFGGNGSNGHGIIKLAAKDSAKHADSHNNGRSGKAKHLQTTEQLKKWLFFPQRAESLKINLVPSQPMARIKLIEEMLYLTEKIRSSLADIENFYLLSAEIKFSDGTIPFKADSHIPYLYFIDGLILLTTFKGETRTNSVVVREADGHFYFETIIETTHPVNDNDSVERVSFIKEGCQSIVLKNLKVINHRLYCGRIVMEPLTKRKTEGDESLCERSIILRLEDFIL